MLAKRCVSLIPLLSNEMNANKMLSIGCKSSKLLRSHGIICTNFVRSMASKDWKKADLPDRTRVYYGILTPQMRAVKIFSLTTSMGGVVAQPILFQKATTMGNIPVIVAVCSFVGFFTFVTPFLLHLISKKYTVYLDYKPKTESYVAGYLTIFNRLKELEFTPNDVKVPDVPGMFTTFVAKGKPLFVDLRLFEEPHHYSKIMGYDKPLDFKLYENSVPVDSSDKKL